MSRRLVWALGGAGVAAVLVGGAVSEGTTPASSSHAVSAETSSAAPATVAAVPSAESAESAATTSVPDVAATSSAAATTSAAAPTSAAALPVSPILSLSCPGSAAGAAPTFGHQIAATAPYTVVIDYGDGERYTNDDQHLGAIFSHRYQWSGTFTVGAVLTDAAGQTSSATCAYRWAAPAPVHASVHTSVPAPHSSTSGSGSGDTYVNVDGNTIHSPVTAPSAPAGATAKCNDGTWSFSQHHSGTCSHHGGVAEWL